MKRTLEKIAILSLSLILISTYSISSVVPMMAEHFSERSITEVEQLVSITSFAIMIVIMLNGALSKVLGERLSIILGMGLIAVAGIVPAFLQQYEIMFLSRLLLGVGIGLVNAYALHMINERYEGEERASLLGYRAAMEGLGSAVLALIAGRLLGFGWNKAFLVYIAALPLLVLYLCFVPKNSGRAEEKAEDGHPEPFISVKGTEPSDRQDVFGEAAKKADRTAGTWKSCLGFLISSMALAFLAICINSANNLRIPSLVLERGIGTEAQSSVIISIIMISSIFGGLCFGKLNQILQEKITGVSMMIFGAGILLIANAGSLVIMGIGAMIAGAAQNMMVTALFNNASNRLPANMVKTGTTFVLVGCNLGASCSAFTLKVIGVFSEALSVSFVVYALLLLGLGVVILVAAPFCFHE